MTTTPRDLPAPAPQARPAAAAQTGTPAPGTLPPCTLPPGPAALPPSRSTVITLPAEIDVTNHRQIQDIAIRALDDGAAVLVADASSTTFCDCAGARTLIEIHQRAATAGAQLRLVAAGPEVRLILAMTGADHLLDGYPTLAAALADG